MATKVGPISQPAYFDTDATFRTWVQAFHDAFVALGFTQAADSGQINTATVSKPSGSNVVAGYEIWKFADTLQSSVPMLFKIEYGSVGAADRAGIWFTPAIGSTNGTGTLTGQIGARQQAGPQGSKSAGVVLPMYMCSDGSDLNIGFNLDAASNYGALNHFSRLRDNTGAPTNEGAFRFDISSSNYNAITQFIPVTGSVPGSVQNSCPAISPSYFNRSTMGENADVCPVMIPAAGGWRYTRLLLTSSSDFGALGTFVTTIFGGTHTFLALAGTPSGTNLGTNGNGGNPGFAMPWE